MRTCMLNCCRPLIRPTWDSEAQKTYSAFHIVFSSKPFFVDVLFLFEVSGIFRRACGDMFPVVVEKCSNLQFINFASAIFRKISEWVSICCQGYQSATPDSKRFPGDRFGCEGNQQRSWLQRGILIKNPMAAFECPCQNHSNFWDNYNTFTLYCICIYIIYTNIIYIYTL